MPIRGPFYAHLIIIIGPCWSIVKRGCNVGAGKVRVWGIIRGAVRVGVGVRGRGCALREWESANLPLCAAGVQAFIFA